MSAITWNKEMYGTNVTAHDEEHQEIFNRSNELHDCVGSGDRDLIGKRLDALLDCVASHFASEEENLR